VVEKKDSLPDVVVKPVSVYVSGNVVEVDDAEVENDELSESPPGDRVHACVKIIVKLIKYVPSADATEVEAEPKISHVNTHGDACACAGNST